MFSEIQTLPFAELRRWILEGEAAIAGLDDGPERDTRIRAVKALRERLMLYAEHMWAVRAWCAEKIRRKRRRPSDGPIVA